MTDLKGRVPCVLPNAHTHGTNMRPVPTSLSSTGNHYSDFKRHKFVFLFQDFLQTEL